jgi:hypothetical protein
VSTIFDYISPPENAGASTSAWKESHHDLQLAGERTCYCDRGTSAIGYGFTHRRRLAESQCARSWNSHNVNVSADMQGCRERCLLAWLATRGSQKSG